MVMIDIEDAVARVGRLESAVAAVAAIPWEELPVPSVAETLARLETIGCRLPAIGYDAINKLGEVRVPAGSVRLRDHLAGLLHISANDAANRIATAGALAADAPRLPETAAAARHGLIGAEHVRIIRDTVAKLPDNAGPAVRGRFDLELAGVAVAERPEVLRREAAKLLAEFDAGQSDPVDRGRTRRARRGFTLGPQDADGMSRGRFCLDPEARAYLEAVLAKLARPGMCNASDPLPIVDGDPDPVASACDCRTTAQRHHDAVKAALRGLLASGELGRHRGLRVTVVVTMTLSQLESASGVAMTGGGSTIPAEVAIAMAAHAHHYLYIYDENSGRPIYLGRSKRLASADHRIVLHAIDGGCSAPDCDQPAYNCDVHHLIEWSIGGTTDLDRLTLLCERNHQGAGPTEAQWQARRRYDEESLGRTLWYPPKSVDPARQPRANRYHRRPNPPRSEPGAA